MPAESPLLEVGGLTKRFGAVVALDDVHFDLREGEVHALCGENGAGKSTLIKILTGIYGAGSYEGSVRVGGQERRFTTVRDAQRAGIAAIHQELALVDEMSVAENVFLGHEPLRLGLVDGGRMVDATRELLERFGIDVSPQLAVKELGIGQKQLVEIAKALQKDSRILILDEPSTALTEREVEVLLGIVGELRRRGVACIYVSHKLDEVFRIADRITVLRDGKTVTTFATHEASQETLIEHMVGRPLNALMPPRSSRPGDVVLRVSNLSVAERPGAAPRLVNLSFEVRAGEVLGIGGLMGAGRSELLLHLIGAWGHRVGGSVELRGRELGAAPRACIDQGVVLVSEDRKRFGLVPEQSVGFNLSLSSLRAVSRFGIVDREREASRNGEWARSVRLKAPGLEAPVSALSGGNQQKVVLGKALLTRPDVLLLDEPTRGIDVGAKHEIYQLINELTAERLAVVLVSSELPELIGMSDRILMLANGVIAGRFEGETVSQEQLLGAALRGARLEEVVS